MSVADEIAKLKVLLSNGSISQEEYDRAKQALFDSLANAGAPTLGQTVDQLGSEVGGFFQRETNWAMLIHLSQFMGYLLPLAGFITPVVLWQMKKEQPYLDRHGRAVVNWMLSVLLYGFIAAILCFVVIGVPIFYVIGVLAVVLPIIGAIRAYEGKLWSYSASIRFFRES